MPTSRFTEEQIIAIVREYEAGAKLTELCRRHNVSPATFYKWRAKYGGVGGSGAKRARALGGEKRRRRQAAGGGKVGKPGRKGGLGKKCRPPRPRGRGGGKARGGKGS